MFRYPLIFGGFHQILISTGQAFMAFFEFRISSYRKSRRGNKAIETGPIEELH